jgi:glycosyltransferase
LIIIDGKSTDKTLEVIKEHAAQINYLVSETDQGIYDALNKGIKVANGEIIGILHSDDLFYSDDILCMVSEIFKANPSVEAVYGDLQYVKRDNTITISRKWNSGSFKRERMNWGWMPPHPTLFIRKECFKKFGDYDLRYKSAADYDLILRFLYKNNIKTEYIPKVLVKMRVGGLSNLSLKNRWRANREDYKAMQENEIPFAFFVAILKPLRKLNQFWNKNA